MEGFPQKRTTEVAPGIEFPTDLLMLAITPLGGIARNIRRHDVTKSLLDRASGFRDLVPDDYVDPEEPQLNRMGDNSWALTASGHQWFVDTETLRQIVAGERILDLSEE